MRSIVGTVLVFIAALSWSTAGLFTRVVSTDIPTTLFGRSLSGGICVFLIYSISTKKNICETLKFRIGEFVISLLSTAGMICFISAFFYTSIANVTLLYGLMPLATLLLSAAFLHQRPKHIDVLCCFLAGAGVATMAWAQKDVSDWIGFALALGMTFFMAALTVSTKFFPEADVTKATYLSAFFAALIMAPFSDFQSITPSDVAWLAAYGAVNVGLGFGIYLIGVSRVSALTAALVGLVEIPLAPVWAFVLFGEQVGLSALVGGAVVFSAASIYVWSSNRSAT